MLSEFNSRLRPQLDSLLFMCYCGSMDRREYMREYQRAWVASRRAEWLSDKSCAVCGLKDNLEIDHIDPSQKVCDPGELWSLSPTNPKRISELAKCQVLCQYHHLEKTKKEYVTTRKHGRATYERYGCRCEICVVAKQEHNAKRYARLG